MKPLLKVILVLALVFTSTFLIIRMLGVLTVDDITLWLEKATAINPLYVFGFVILILAIDIFIAVPTLTTCILAGYFLGFPFGGLGASLGMMLAEAIGYWLSYLYGEKLLKIIIRNEEKRAEAKATFGQYGLAMILLSRSSPIFPEVCACMAGTTRISFPKFYLAWALNTIPYALIAAYAGSVSSPSKPKPAIYAVLGPYFVLWLAWFVFRRQMKAHPKV